MVYMKYNKDRNCIVCGDTFGSRISNYDGEYNGEILCNKHLLQVKRNGKVTNSSKSKIRDNRVCDICGDNFEVRQISINNNYNGLLLCSKHYTQVRNHNIITDETKSHIREKRICAVCGTDEKVIYYKDEGIMLCRRHYDQKYIYGKIFERTVFDRNEIIILSDFAEVILYDGKQNEVSRAIIDIEDINLVKDCKWRLNTWGYADTKINGALTFMQNLIYGRINEEEIVDHVDRNPLNNKKENLRIANKSTNAINAGIRSSNTSGVTGVAYSKTHKLWRAYINYNKKRIELGWFDNFQDAVKSRLIAERDHHGDFAAQQHLFEQYGVNV